MNKTIEEAIKVGWNICDKAANPIALNPAACAADAVHELTRALMRGSLDEFEHNAVIYCDGKRIEVYASKKPTDPDDPDQ